MTVTETRGLPGIPASVAAARAFVRELLAAAGCPDIDGPELCASELVTNSVEHSRSAGPAGTIMLRVDAWPGGARLEVRDAGPLPGTLLAAVPAARTWTGDVPCWSCRLHCPPGCDCVCHDNDSDRQTARGARRTSPDSESGRGLWIVTQTADTFGFAPGVAWCLFRWPCEASAEPPAAAVAALLGPSRPVQRRHGRLGAVAHRVTRWRARRYASHRLEREARDVLGVPWRYPENLTRRQHELDRLAAELWPNCEYIREIR
jgi:anti-sigma regulatory factor (Ser/Thr protein kinase)